MASYRGLGIRRWRAGSWLCAGLLLLPLAAIFFQAFFAGGEGVIALWQRGLPTYLLNSLGVAIGTVSLSLAFGLPAAWLMTQYRFPGQRLLRWMLCLPLAVPPYLTAYIYTDLLDAAGPAQSALRRAFSLPDALPSMRSSGGACMILALALYPYVYLLARNALLALPATLIHSARLLNHSPDGILRRVTLPLVWPAIAVGASLVAMEALADFGAVSYLAPATLTTAIYDAWQGRGDPGAAMRISCVMLLLVFFIVTGAFYSRRRQQLYQRDLQPAQENVPALRGIKKTLAQGYCWGLILLAAGIPCMMLIGWSFRYFTRASGAASFHYALNSVLLSSLAAGVTVLVALSLLFYSRLSGQRSAMPRLACLGYAMPGMALALGVLIPLTAFDDGVNALAGRLSLPLPGLLLSGSMVALVFAYSVRFSAMAIVSIESRMAKIPVSLDMANRLLQGSAGQMFKRVHWPLLRRGVLTGALLVFLESVKELNASLLLRPPHFDTLATYVFRFIAEERLEQAALPAMMLVLIGLIPVIWLTAVLENKK